MSSAPWARRSSAAETVGGFLAATSIFISCIGVAYRPLRLIPLAIVLALIATGIGGWPSRLAAWAVGIGALCFTIGFAAHVITSNPLW